MRSDSAEDAPDRQDEYGVRHAAACGGAALSQ
jgi:hypothetical protein